MNILNKFFSFIGSLIKFSFQVFIIMVMLIAFYYAMNKEEIPKEINLAQINLVGAIMDDSEILDEIYKIKNNDKIKGVLLYIDSPGGALAPSFEISTAIKELNEVKPVIVYASGNMTSGSYLSGIWAKKIYANKGSFIGSIGVIVQGTNIEELSNKIGISSQVVSAGEYKEVGTFLRKWSEKERQSLQELVDKSYNLFINEVALARNLDINREKEWANARVFLADDAKNLGLIDDIATYLEAKNETAKIANVDNPSWKEKTKYDDFLETISTKTANLILSAFLTSVR